MIEGDNILQDHENQQQTNNQQECQDCVYPNNSRYLSRDMIEKLKNKKLTPISNINMHTHDKENTTLSRQSSIKERNEETQNTQKKVAQGSEKSTDDFEQSLKLKSRNLKKCKSELSDQSLEKLQRNIEGNFDLYNKSQNVKRQKPSDSFIEKLCKHTVYGKSFFKEINLHDLNDVINEISNEKQKINELYFLTEAFQNDARLTLKGSFIKPNLKYDVNGFSNVVKDSSLANTIYSDKGITAKSATFIKKGKDSSIFCKTSKFFIKKFDSFIKNDVTDKNLYKNEPNSENINKLNVLETSHKFQKKSTSNELNIKNYSISTKNSIRLSQNKFLQKDSILEFDQNSFNKIPTNNTEGIVRQPYHMRAINKACMDTNKMDTFQGKIHFGNKSVDTNSMSLDKLRNLKGNLSKSSIFRPQESSFKDINQRGNFGKSFKKFSKPNLTGNKEGYIDVIESLDNKHRFKGKIGNKGKPILCHVSSKSLAC